MKNLLTTKYLSLAIFIQVLFTGCILYDVKLGVSQWIFSPMLPITLLFLFSCVDLTILWSNFKKNNYLRVTNFLILICSISLYFILNFNELFDINLWLGGIVLFGLLVTFVGLLKQLDKERSFQILLPIKKIKQDYFVLLLKFVGSILFIGFSIQAISDLIKDVSVYNYTWLETFGFGGYYIFICILAIYIIVKVNPDNPSSENGIESEIKSTIQIINRLIRGL